MLGMMGSVKWDQEKFWMQAWRILTLTYTVRNYWGENNRLKTVF